MKPTLLSLLIISLLLGPAVQSTTAQNLQLHYDLRHTVSPSQNPQNFPTLYFEYWKQQDPGNSTSTPADSSPRHTASNPGHPNSATNSIHSNPPTHSNHPFIHPGSFLLKTEADLFGPHNNIGKFYLQVSESFRCWQPRIYLCLQYSGGAGITEPKQYSYYIPNTWSIGASYPYQWKGTYLTAQLFYKNSPSNHSQGLLYTLYWWKGLLHYKLEIAGDFSIWTDQLFSFFAEPQIWYNLNKTLSLGSKINLYYHVNTPGNLLQVAPTLAIKCRL